MSVQMTQLINFYSLQLIEVCMCVSLCSMEVSPKLTGVNRGTGEQVRKGGIG